MKYVIKMFFINMKVLLKNFLEKKRNFIMSDFLLRLAMRECFGSI